MLSPASAQTTSRSMKSGKPCGAPPAAPRCFGSDRCSARNSRDPAASTIGQNMRCHRAGRRAPANAATASATAATARARKKNAGARGSRYPAWISRRRNSLMSPRVLARIVLRRVVDQPLRRDLAGVAQRARIVAARIGRAGADFRPRAVSRRRAPESTAIAPNASAAADRNTNALTIRVEPSPPEVCIMRSKRASTVRSGNCTFCT